MDKDQNTLHIGRQYKTLRELALERMRDAIMSLHFRPGDRLVERPLCEQLGVSRTVVREVLRHLEAEGLVQTVPQKGPVVARPSLEDAREIYEIRAQLEALAAAACAEQADDETLTALHEALEAIATAYAGGEVRDLLAATSRFYQIMFSGGRKRVGWEIVQSLNARINFLRAMTLTSPGRETEGMPEMRGIYEAIARRDPQAARAACLSHVTRASEIAERLITDKSVEPH